MLLQRRNGDASRENQRKRAVVRTSTALTRSRAHDKRRRTHGIMSAQGERIKQTDARVS